MPRKHKSAAPPPAPRSASEVKPLIDALDNCEQFNLFALLMADPKSHIGKLIMSGLQMSLHYQIIAEEELGLAPEDMDPLKVLSTAETLKEAKRRLGKRGRSTGAVKQLRHRAKEKARQLADLQHVAVTLDQSDPQVTK
jgi:hypothetical protein